MIVSMTINLIRLVAALAASEFVHTLFEIWGIRQKVSWLGLVTNGKPHGTWPINVDSLLKVWGLHLAILMVVSATSYELLRLLNTSVNATALIAAVTRLVTSTTVVIKTHT